MNHQFFDGKRPLVTIPQIIIFVVVLIGLLVAIDINRRSQVGQSMGGSESALQGEVSAAQTRQVALQATLSYVESEAYVVAYARNEVGYVQPGEQRVVPLVIEVTPAPTPPPPPPPDPALSAEPWQAWWQLLFDRPLPTR